MTERTSDHNRAATRRSRLRNAIVISVFVHLVVILALLVWYVRQESTHQDGEGVRVANADTTTSADGATTPPQAKPESDPPSPTVNSDVVAMQVEKVAEQYRNLPDDEKVDALGEKLKELDELSSDESIEQVTSTLETAVGSDRATQPADAPVEGEFDFDTAQLHDVRRVKGDDDAWRYYSVLLDAEGRTIEAELDEAAGKTTYDTMQQLKAFPFADQIYRRLAMPVIDSVMATQRAAEQAERDAKRKAADEATEPKIDAESSEGTEEASEPTDGS